MHILDSQNQVLRFKTVRLVEVLWRHRGVEEATWECEDTMRATYHFLFEDESALFNIRTRMTISYACVCVCKCA